MEEVWERSTGMSPSGGWKKDEMLLTRWSMYEADLNNCFFPSSFFDRSYLHS